MKRATRIAGGRRSVIQREYRDSDGYWIELMPGWQNGADPGTHGIVEDSKREAYRTLQAVERCECRECRDLITQAAQKEQGR